MDNWGIWKIIKVGFWLGIGFMVPQMVVLYGGTVLSVFAIPSMMEASFEGLSGSTDSSISSFTSKFDRTDQIEINEYREQKNGNQLLILGSVTNKGKKLASSIQLEAELLDKAGKFVFECSKYINKKLKPSESENFQIKCGCGKNPVPKHATVNVRVVSASSY